MSFKNRVKKYLDKAKPNEKKYYLNIKREDILILTKCRKVMYLAECTDDIFWGRLISRDMIFEFNWKEVVRKL